ncbi:MAG: GatB/YqeY domain-containing protein [Candidatus Nealsonbacteria bacterium]
MMLKQKIKDNLSESLKNKDELTRSVLRLVLSAILNKEKEKIYKISQEEAELNEQEIVKKSNLTDEEVLEIIFSEAKKVKESILEFEKGGRNDLVEKEKKDLEILQRYLPKQMSSDEIEQIVKIAVEKVGASEIKDMGKVMAEIMPKIKGKADGNKVNRIVRELLNK